MKKLILFVIIFIAFMCSTVAAASTDTLIEEVRATKNLAISGSYGENIKWERYSDDILILTGEGEMEDRSLNERPWHMAWYANEENKYAIEKVDIFYFKTVIVGEGITSIGAYAFYGIDSLEKVVLPDSLTKIGVNAFGKCAKLPELKIPETVTDIGMGAFYGCKELSGLTIPEGVLTLETVFSTSGITSVAVPDGVKELIGTFSFCNKLTDVSLPDSIEVIDGGFADCKSLERISLPASLKKITGSAFSGCIKLKEITIPQGVTEIGAWSFNNCSKLGEIVLPKGLTEIGERCFNACDDLKSVVIPKTVMKIGESAFSGCLSLEKVYYEGMPGEWQMLRILSGNDLLNNAEVIYNINMEDYMPEQPESSGIEIESEFQEIVVAGASAWAEEYIKEAIKKQLVPENNRNMYAENITREECCELIFALMRELNLINTESVNKKVFSDTENPAVISLADCGIIYGKEGNMFAPHDSLVREEFAAILNRVCKRMEAFIANADNVVFNDSDDISPWAMADVGVIAQNGIMIGDAENNFKPKENITKESVIITVLKIYNLNNQKKRCSDVR